MNKPVIDESGIKWMGRRRGVRAGVLNGDAFGHFRDVPFEVRHSDRPVWGDEYVARAKLSDGRTIFGYSDWNEWEAAADLIQQIREGDVVSCMTSSE